MKQNVNCERILFHESEKHIGKMLFLGVGWKFLQIWSGVTLFAQQFSRFTDSHFSVMFQYAEDN